jgi:ParB/RepB/Spo0J family partition protein
MPDSNAPELVKFIPASAITVPDALNRWTGGKADMDLMKSIETQGLLQPIGVYGSDETGYTLSWGSRRYGSWTSSPFLQSRPIPAMVVPASAAMRGTLDENSFRRQLTALDKARVAKYALETTGNEDMTMHDLADIVGLSATRVANLRRVWQAPELWGRVNSDAGFPLEAAITLSALPAQRRAAFLANLDTNFPKAKTA